MKHAKRQPKEKQPTSSKEKPVRKFAKPDPVTPFFETKREPGVEYWGDSKNDVFFKY